MAAAAIPAAISAASLYAGIKTGVTQGILSGNSSAVKAGLGQVAKGDLNIASAGKLPSAIAPNTKTTALPTINSDSVNKAKLQSLFNLQNRSGRASTLLTTATTDKFGG